jgi:hypothetical protein
MIELTPVEQLQTDYWIIESVEHWLQEHTQALHPEIAEVIIELCKYHWRQKVQQLGVEVPPVENPLLNVHYNSNLPKLD